MNTQEYFKHLEKEVKKVYEVAEKARAKGLDPVDKVEIPLAMSMAEKVVSLISTIYPQMEGSGIAKRILELEKDYGKLDPAVSIQIAEEIARQKFCQFANLIEAIDAGARIGFAYTTLGVVSSPIEGLTEIKVRKTREGKDYLAAYFSGPVRSAGGTGAAFAVVIIDHLREIFGYAKYDPTEEEIKRAVSELSDYHERITNLQYMPTEEEILFLARNVPIQVTGEKSEKLEVSNYKNLDRIETNYLRSGYCLVLGEGIAQKAAKIYRYVGGLRKRGFKLSDWSFLEEYLRIHEKREKGKTDTSPTYIKDIVAGRPIFGYPSRSGGFRFRYGRGRTSGFSATSIHPATMAVTDAFIALGTQLKIEKPTKGCAVTSCDLIDGPIVKLFSGSVKKLKTKEDAKKYYSDIEEVIYLGDLLFPYGDVANRNHVLVKPGYVEEWWHLELEKIDSGLAKSVDPYNVSIQEAVKISDETKIPLHPSLIFYWKEITREQFFSLIDWLKSSRVSGKLILSFTKSEQEKYKEGKRALELLGVEHEFVIENVVINEVNSKALFLNLGIDLDFIGKEGMLKDFFDFSFFNEEVEEMPLEIVNSLSKYKIKDKSGEFIGARMGRPEKAKLRKLTGSPNTLFPVGNEGGRLRSVQVACGVGSVWSSFPLFYCEECMKECIYALCLTCKNKCKKQFFFFQTKEKSFLKELNGAEGKPYYSRAVNIKDYYDDALSKLNLKRDEMPVLVKGVRGLSSEEKHVEHLAKGILRARHGLQVNKDGTIRFDVTELPLVAFKPKEIFVSIGKLIELGYNEDVYGNPLKREDQILELKPHDILLSSSPSSPDERADDVFTNVASFVDEELERFYGLEKFHNVKKREDLVGQIGVCMAPHNCAGVICRFIGFTHAQGIYASPYMHAAIRRDCLGYNNYVSIKENGKWKIEKIGDFIERSKPIEKADFFGTLSKRTKGLFTWSNPGKKEVKEITKHQPTKLLRIHSEDGREIELTKDHRVYVKGKEEKRAHELKEGDKLMVSYRREIEEKDIKEIFLPEIFKDREDVMLRDIRDYLGKFESLSKRENFWQRNSFPIIFVEEFLSKYGKTLHDLPQEAKISVKRDNVLLPVRIPFSEKLLEVIGLYIAEGFIRKNDSKKGFYQISIANIDQEIKSLIVEVFLTHFNLRPSEKHENHLTFSSRLVYELFKNYFQLGDRARNKRISSLFLDLKKEKLAALLRGYFEGDGSVSFSDTRITCDTISQGLKHDLSFVLSRFDIFTKFYDYKKKPGPKVREFYLRKKREIPTFKVTKIIIPSNFVKKFINIGFISNRKSEILAKIVKKNPRGMRIDSDESYVYPKITRVEELKEDISYCFNVDEEHNFFANDILVHNCDGDEAAIMLLSDVLINFSRKFLPSHRGGTQDAPLVLNAKIDAGEVDDQILDFEMCTRYPLELYELAEKAEHSSKVDIYTVKKALRDGINPFLNLGFTHDTNNINDGVICSSYKTLATMAEKVEHQMALAEKLRSADTSDTARLIIERHFIRDTKGNLRNFSIQEFRCVACNEIMRRPPLNGVCIKCKGKIIFTVHEGGIRKYLEIALELAKKYGLSNYIKQNLDIIKRTIDSIFGRELEKQESISKWF